MHIYDLPNVIALHVIVMRRQLQIKFHFHCIEHWNIRTLTIGILNIEILGIKILNTRVLNIKHWNIKHYNIEYWIKTLNIGDIYVAVNRNNILSGYRTFGLKYLDKDVRLINSCIEWNIHTAYAFN